MIGSQMSDFTPARLEKLWWRFPEGGDFTSLGLEKKESGEEVGAGRAAHDLTITTKWV